MRRQQLLRRRLEEALVGTARLGTSQEASARQKDAAEAGGAGNWLLITERRAAPGRTRARRFHRQAQRERGRQRRRQGRQRQRRRSARWCRAAETSCQAALSSAKMRKPTDAGGAKSRQPCKQNQQRQQRPCSGRHRWRDHLHRPSGPSWRRRRELPTWLRRRSPTPP
jgi:hypothetical protein